MTRVSDRSRRPERPVALSRRAVLASALGGLLLVLWFLFAWLGLNRNAVDAAGESIGTALAVLALTAVVGAIRQQRR